MKVTFLGTGSALPTGERYQAGLLVSEADRHLLLDCGSGSLQRLAASDVGYEGVSAVLLSHLHLDHVSDLLPLLVARWIDDEPMPEVVGPQGTAAMVDGFFEAHGYLDGRFDVPVREVAEESFEVAGFEVASRRTEHSIECLAYRFDDRFTFGADSEAVPSLARFADGSAVLVHECSFPDDVEVEGHTTPSALGELLSDLEIEVGRVYLTHLFPHTEGREDELLDSISTYYDGEVRVASDGLTVEIG